VITASMSTIAWREPGLAQAVASILPQVDRLNVFLQGYEYTPACLDDPRVTVATGPDSAFGASAKYHWVWDGLVVDGYHFAVDDDIEYPPDYVQRCIAKIDEYGKRAVVGFHGAVYKETVRKYFRDREVWRFDKACETNRFVHMLGTGTSAMHTSTMRLTREDFTAANSCDLFLALACQRQQVPMLCIARPAQYLKALRTAFDPRSASASEDYARRMVELHGSIPEWRIYT